MEENKATTEQKGLDELLYETIREIGENEKWRILGFAQCLQLTKGTPKAG